MAPWRESGHERASRQQPKDRAAGKRQQPCFTLEINRRPVLVLAAVSLRSAVRRSCEAWFTDELQRMQSGGKPILRAGDERLVRPARPDEAAKLELERGLDEARREDTKYSFAFLIQVDNDPN